MTGARLWIARGATACLWLATVRGFRETVIEVTGMSADTVVLAVGVLLGVICFIFVFEIREGQADSRITGIGKRRLLAVWILLGLGFAFALIWTLFNSGFSFQARLVPILAGLILSFAAFIIVKRLQEPAGDGAAELSKTMRRGLLGVCLILIGCFIYLLQLPDHKGAVLGSTVWILVVTLFLTWLIYAFLVRKPDTLANDGDPMPIFTRRVLVFYLLLFGTCLMALLWRIGSLEFPNAGLKIETVAPPSSPTDSDALTCANLSSPPFTSLTNGPSSGGPGASAGTPAGSAGGARPVLCQLFPQTTVAAVPLVYVTAYGQNFTPDSKLRFNQKPQPTVFLTSERIQAQLDEATIDSMDPVSVDIITNAQLSRSLAMSVTKSKAEDVLLGWHFWLTREHQLLILALLAGALGSFVHALKSFADFVGNRTLTSSWFWWYITRPFLGAALAVIFYAALRGGFMAGTQADAKSVSQFGVITIGALVGMFADKASDKLADIWDMLFKGADARGGKLAAPIINQFNPPFIAHGSPATELKIIGERLGSVTTVKFDNAIHSHGAVTPTEVTVPLSAAELINAKTIKISVVGENGESPTRDFQITA